MLITFWCSNPLLDISYMLHQYISDLLFNFDDTVRNRFLQIYSSLEITWFYPIFWLCYRQSHICFTDICLHQRISQTMDYDEYWNDYVILSVIQQRYFIHRDSHYNRSRIRIWEQCSSSLGLAYNTFYRLFTVKVII